MKLHELLTLIEELKGFELRLSRIDEYLSGLPQIPLPYFDDIRKEQDGLQRLIEKVRNTEVGQPL